MEELYDVVIIGAGPAGLTAGLYTSRAKFSTLIMEREAFGGELVNRDIIENFPGFSSGVLGPDLASEMVRQVNKYGAKIRLEEVEQIQIEDSMKRVITAQGEIMTKSIIVACGAHPKKLGVPGEQEFLERGVFYCATCDGPSFANKTVVVAGGGDSGITEALFLAKFVSKVIIVELLPYLSANKTLQERAFSDAKTEIICGVKIEAIEGGNKVNTIHLIKVETGQKFSLAADGILVHIGIDPNTHFVKNILPLNAKGQIMVNEYLETKVAGIFAAGDVRHNSPMQISTAVGDGATAALTLERRILRGY